LRERAECSEIAGDDQSSLDLADRKRRGSNKLSRLTPEVRNELKQALRDSSDWHPRLNDQVEKLTDIKNTRIVRSRIYVTSASTMHSLVNILRHGHCAAQGSEPILPDLGECIDLNYLSHLVFRCYEAEAGEVARSKAKSEADAGVMSQEKAKYRVEVSMSPGMQVFRDGQRVQWPHGCELCEDTCKVAPMEIIADSVELGHIERILTDAIKEYGGASGEHEDEEDVEEDKGSDAM